ncbi:hypothetical protein BEUL_1279 [Bifidobacterium eulemuris]|uniref:HNH endonuclease n=1 Tax=Bifidobacterium eulemuris TaxID=1765219 RepID=A0A261GBB1_9BIFI|nr:hypothetical protein BEUL_1279 [Bifidobacterium eulemuris]
MVFSPGLPLMCGVAGCGGPVCSKGLCRRHYDMARRNGAPVELSRQRLCAACHQWFEPKRSDQLYCSHRCRQRYLRLNRMDAERYPKNPRTKLFVAPVSAASVDGAPVVVEPFTDMQVFDRSDGLCAVCGGAIDVEVDVFDPDGLSSQWLVPVDMGGVPALSNRVPVHRRCKGGVSDGRKRKKVEEGRDSRAEKRR